MVIDDDPHIREVITETLSDEGFDVIALGDGREAVSYALRQPPGLIVLDLMMPKMSGWQVMDVLRTTPQGAAIPIVLVSASRELDQTARTSDVAAHIAKPFDIDTLVAIVERHCLAPKQTA